MSSLSSAGGLAALAKTPALAPPPGVVPNFIDPYNQGPILLVIGSILLALMMILVTVRAYTKIFIQRKLSWDDCSLPKFSALGSSSMLMFVSDLWTRCG